MRMKSLLMLIMGALCGSGLWGQIPNILAIEPPSVNPGAGQVTLNLIGTGFPSGECFVYVNGGLIGSCGQSPSKIPVAYAVPATAQTVRVQIGSPTKKSLPFPLQVGAASAGVGLAIAPGSPITVIIGPDETRQGSARTGSTPARIPQGPSISLAVGGPPQAPLPPAARPNASTTTTPAPFSARAAGTVSLNGAHSFATRAAAFKPVPSKNPPGIQNAAGTPLSNANLGLGAYVTGDFNNDGIVDVIALNVDGYLLVLLGNGDGSFGGFNSYTPVLGAPVALATGDFNNDGNLDLAFTTTGQAAVMYGDGTGLFPTGTIYPLPTATEIPSPHGLVGGDFNGDGNLDLAIATNLGMTILLNIPGNAPEYRVYDEGPAFGVALGDFDGDGYPDVAFATAGFPYYTVGGAESLTTYVIPSGGGTLPIVGDFNNDGILDFALLNGSSLGLFINETLGFFNVASQNLSVTATSGVTADLNHDGYLDLILGQDSGPVAVLLGAAGPAFAPPAGDPNRQGLLQGVTGAVYGLGDFNNDGFVDTAQGTFSAGFYAELQAGAAVFTPAALNFGTQPEGVSSNTQTIQFQNVGSLPLALAVDLGGVNYIDFGGRQTCGSSLAAGAACQTTVYFQPTETGALTAQIEFYDNGGGVQGTQQFVQLNGTGVAVAVSPSSLNLLATYPLSSPPQTVTVTNHGKNAVNINSVSIVQSGSDFSETTNCGGTLAAAASCAIVVVYHSAGTTRETAVLNIAVSGSPSTAVGLAGQEQVSYYGFPVATPSAITFPDVQVGAFDSMLMPFTVMNYGTQPLAITSILISDGDSTDFFVNPGSCAYLLASQSCQAQAIFYPHMKARDTATITVSGSSNGMPTASATVALAGSGTVGIPWLQSISPDGMSLAAANKGFTLTVSGGNFQPTSVVQLGSKSLKTTAAAAANGGLTLTATIPPKFITAAGTAFIKVVNAGAPGSNAALLPLTSAPVKNPKYANSADSPLNLGGAWQVNLAYLNQDTVLDAVVVTGPNTVAGVLLGNGDGTFKSGQAIPPGVAYFTPGVPTPLFPVAAVVRDFNGDGKPDLAMISVPASVTIFLGNGDGTFIPSAIDPLTGLPAAILLNSVGTVGNLPPAGMGVDLNGDGLMDLVVSDQAGGQLWVLLGNGNGSFQTPASVSAPGISGFIPGDFNGDNFIDLAVLNQTANTLTVLTGNGFGAFTPGASIATGKLPAGIAAADFNGDGKLDVAITNMTDGTVSIFTGSGAGTFTAAGSIAVGKGPIPIVAADLNSDGKADLAVGVTGSSGAVILLGSGAATFTRSYSAATGTGPLAIAIGDLNSDGRLDILTANRGAGTVSSLLSQK